MARKKRYQWDVTDQEDGAEAPSRSQKKRESTALQALGEELARLPLSRLKSLPLSPELDEALRLLARISDNEGRRRQKQFIGRLMREVDHKAVRTALDNVTLGHSQDNAAFHRAERLRDTLLDASPEALGPLLDSWPEHGQELRGLITEAREERASLGSSKSRPPHAQRALFRKLRELVG
ncbi:MAG: ribosome biogenesis factor YjgA [Desulfovibrionaceae bacterium]